MEVYGSIVERALYVLNVIMLYFIGIFGVNNFWIMYHIHSLEWWCWKIIKVKSVCNNLLLLHPWKGSVLSWEYMVHFMMILKNKILFLSCQHHCLDWLVLLFALCIFLQKNIIFLIQRKYPNLNDTKIKFNTQDKII